MSGKNKTNTGQLFVIATPIGNLEDLSLRAIRVLSEVDLVLAEDTRHTQTLLQHYQISKKITSLHEHNERQKIAGILSMLADGSKLALVSDAGTPLISDPGYNLIKTCREMGVMVTPIPGPSSVTAALSVLGIPCQSFTFMGFLPRQQKARQTTLTHLARSEHTTVLFESPKRVLDTLLELETYLGPDRFIGIARELTKKFETTKAGSISSIRDWYASEPEQHRGEFVLVIQGVDIESVNKSEEQALDTLKLLLQEGLGLKQASKIASKLTGISTKELYRLGLQNSP